ncbi:MAG: bifunctional aminoglycoside phosphotransferase/ATP-binding protein, partial [Planctomycetota bacterium]
MQTQELITALTDPAAYGADVGAVSLVQTHISLLFFAGERVYKVKKAVDLGFVDYSTLERRRHFCEEEVRLNRRLAPSTYLGVVGIARNEDGRIRVGGDGEIFEYAVEMRRLPSDRMMSVLLDRGEIDNAQMDAIIALLVDFHRASATGPGVDEFGLPDEVGRQLQNNIDGLTPFVGNVDDGAILSEALRDRLRSRAHTWLGDNSDLLERRVRDGRIREGHGDLHAGNICLTRDGIVIYDCIEFADRFRCRDVACEMAFLAMDLDLGCWRGFAAYLLRRYADATSDPALPEVAAFYKLHLAVVRAKVASLRASDAAVGAEDHVSARHEAMGYCQLATAYTLPPSLILTCGLPGTGKSHAAEALARPFEAVVLRSDLVRKELGGIAPTERAPGRLYAAEFSDETYAALVERAFEVLARGRSVVVDATFSTAARRAPFVARAARGGVPCALIELTCPDEVIRDRMRRRVADASEVSDADWNVYLAARKRFERPTELDAAMRVTCDGRRPVVESVSKVLERLA